MSLPKLISYKVEFIHQAVLHPKGAGSFFGYVQGTAKKEATLEAHKYLKVYLQDSDEEFSSMFKAPRLTTITEDEYCDGIAELNDNAVLVADIKLLNDYAILHCALVAMYEPNDEGDAYEAEQVVEAEAFLADYLVENDVVVARYEAIRDAVLLAIEDKTVTTWYDIDTLASETFMALSATGSQQLSTEASTEMVVTSHDVSGLVGALEAHKTEITADSVINNDNCSEQVIKFDNNHCGLINPDNQVDHAMTEVNSENLAIDDAEEHPLTHDLDDETATPEPDNSTDENTDGSPRWINGAHYRCVSDLNEDLDKIPNGGALIIENLLNELYHACDGYSNTSLGLVHRDPALIEWSEAVSRDEVSDEIIIGTAVHANILEPNLFAKDFARMPEFDGRTNNGKAIKATFDTYVFDNNMTVLSDENYQKVLDMSDSARAHPTVKKMLSNGRAEVSIFYRDEDGMLFKIRPDWLGSNYILDVKTCADADKFDKSVEDFRYHAQDAFYSYVYEKVMNKPVSFGFLAIGKKREFGAYPVRLCHLDEYDKQVGLRDVLQDIATLKTFLKAEQWVGFEVVKRPYWAARNDNFTVEVMA